MNTTQRETVYTDDRLEGVQIRWAGGATFNIWVEGEMQHYHSEGGWTNTDCFTHYGNGGAGNGPTPTQAGGIAEEHFNLMLEEMDD